MATIEAFNGQSLNYTVERHSCGSALFLIRSKIDGSIINSAMSREWVLQWIGDRS